MTLRRKISYSSEMFMPRATKNISEAKGIKIILNQSINHFHPKTDFSLLININNTTNFRSFRAKISPISWTEIQNDYILFLNNRRALAARKRGYTKLQLLWSLFTKDLSQ